MAQFLTEDYDIKAAIFYDSQGEKAIDLIVHRPGKARASDYPKTATYLSIGYNCMWRPMRLWVS
jgi:hypothetical protein